MKKEFETEDSRFLIDVKNGICINEFRFYFNMFGERFYGFITFYSFIDQVCSLMVT